MKVFISGSISIKSLDEKDKTVLDQIVEKNDTVLIGDAFGIDKAVQEYLFAQDYQNVVIYFSGEKVRNNIGDWQTKPQANPDNFTGRDFYQIKDKAMTIECDYGVMFWDGKSKGTKYNMDCMEELGKIFTVFCRSDREF